MPGLPGNNEQQLAIPMPTLAESASAATGDAAIQQPRQPQNLQGLLRFAMEAQAAEVQQRQPPPPTRPLDEDSRSFLQDALKSMTVDVIAVMRENIATLCDVANIPQSEVPLKIEAFERILEYVDNMDIANDFHKINGFAIFEPCLNCRHATIRAHVCDLIAELAQNNPYIQNVICECTSVMPRLLATLQRDDCIEVRIKALYAVSCIVRESTVGYLNLKQHGGIDALKSPLAHEDDKLRTKAAFLLSALIPLDSHLPDILLSNFLPVIMKALKTEHQSSHEHLLALLVTIVENDSQDQLRTQLAKQDDGGVDELLHVLQRNLQFVAGKDEYLEEQEYCEKLIRLVQRL